MALPHLTSLSCCTPTLPADLSGQLTSCSWQCLKLRLNSEGIEYLWLQLQNTGMNCCCTLDRPPLCLILKPISSLWLLTPCRVLILWFHVYSCIFLSCIYFILFLFLLLLSFYCVLHLFIVLLLCYLFIVFYLFVQHFGNLVIVKIVLQYINKVDWIGLCLFCQTWKPFSQCFHLQNTRHTVTTTK